MYVHKRLRPLAGENDVLTPPSDAYAMHAAIRHSRIAQIPSCGHLSTVEQPSAVDETRLHFLADTASGGDAG